MVRGRGSYRSTAAPTGGAPAGGTGVWRARARRAFALLDVLVAGVLTGVVLAAVLGLTGQAISSQAKGEQLQIAAMLADERLNLVLMTGPDRYEGSFDLEGECDHPFEKYRYKVDIADGSEGAAVDVRVTILWRSMGGEQSIVVETKIAPRLGDDPDPDRKPTTPVAREESQ